MQLHRDNGRACTDENKRVGLISNSASAMLLGDIGENESAEVSHAAKVFSYCAGGLLKSRNWGVNFFLKCVYHTSHHLKWLYGIALDWRKKYLQKGAC